MSLGNWLFDFSLLVMSVLAGHWNGRREHHITQILEEENSEFKNVKTATKNNFSFPRAVMIIQILLEAVENHDHWSSEKDMVFII